MLLVWSGKACPGAFFLFEYSACWIGVRLPSWVIEEGTMEEGGLYLDFTSITNLLPKYDVVVLGIMYGRSRNASSQCHANDRVFGVPTRDRHRATVTCCGIASWYQSEPSEVWLNCTLLAMLADFSMLGMPKHCNPPHTVML